MTQVILPSVEQLPGRFRAIKSDGGRFGERDLGRGAQELDPLETLHFHTQDPISDDALASLEGLTQVTHVALGPHALSPRGLSVLTTLPAFRTLWMHASSLTPEMLAPLAQVRPLWTLHLSDTPAADALLEALGELPTLRELRYGGGSLGLTDRGLAGLGRSRSLDCLQLSDGQGTGCGLQTCVGSMQLREVDLTTWPELTDAGVAHLSGVPNLTSVRFPYCKKLTDAVFDTFVCLPALTWIQIGGCRMTDAGLLKLAGLPHLRMVNVSKSSRKITSAGMAALRTAHGSVHCGRY
jgi:F-box/leucine-rich repeat protein 14